MAHRDNRDSIDFGTMDISRLFGKMFFPTIIGMLFTAVFTITDGIFVGHGVGSDALAAVNIVAPLFMITTGLGLMFGVGCSVVVAIYLAQGKVKAAKINVTQSFLAAMTLMGVMTLLLLLFPDQTVTLMGSSERLQPLAKEYLVAFTPFFALFLIETMGLFVIRLDGSPKYAMLCSVLPALLNIGLDYLFIFTFGWGLQGAAWATGISVAVSAMMIMTYILRHSHTIKFYRLKWSLRSIRLSMRNIGYQMRLGSAAMLEELSIALMMLVGNYIFIDMLGEDGVAAFSVACYCFPIVFMVNNSVAQAGQPIISYNYGGGYTTRVKKAFKLIVSVAMLCGAAAAALLAFGTPWLVGMFLEAGSDAYQIATTGIPYFATGCIFFAFNIACIGYYQSVERAKPATVFAVLRGIILPMVAFAALPHLLGIKGAWLAVPVSEFLTAIGICIHIVVRRKRLASRDFTANAA